MRIFFSCSLQISLAEELQQLVAERIDYCSVDTAYEAVDSVEASGDSEMLALWWETVNAPYDGSFYIFTFILHYKPSRDRKEKSCPQLKMEIEI